MKSFKRFIVQGLLALLLVGAAVTPTFASAVTHVEWVRPIRILCSDGGQCPCPGC
jgi:hypothetical protein